MQLLNFHFGPGMHNVIALKLDHCTHPAQHKWLGLLESSLGVPCSTMYHAVLCTMNKLCFTDSAPNINPLVSVAISSVSAR